MTLVFETLRGGCALHGAVWTGAAIPGVIPLVHSNCGCAAQGFLAALSSGAGASSLGGLQIPSTNSLEKHVVFGGGSRLREQIKNAAKVMKGDLFLVLQGCESAMVGDDVSALSKEAAEGGLPAICSLAPGFKGDSRLGYANAIKDLIEGAEALEKTGGLSSSSEPEPDLAASGSALASWGPDFRAADLSPSPLVNILGVVPVTDPGFRGDLLEMARILRGLGLSPNVFLGLEGSKDNLLKAAKASLTLSTSRWGRPAADYLLSRHNVPVLDLGALPVGPEAIEEMAVKIFSALGAPLPQTAALFLAKERSLCESLLKPLDDFRGEIFGAPAALVGDESALLSLAPYLSRELGARIEALVVTDAIDEENGVSTLGALSKTILRCQNQGQIREALLKANPLVILGSSHEAEIADSLQASLMPVSFPSSQIRLSRSYAGYRGAVALCEDFATSALSALEGRDKALSEALWNL
jgi:nitrogenase molybdenum-iron protein beta chain